MEGVWEGALVLGCLGSRGERHSMVTGFRVHTAGVILIFEKETGELLQPKREAILDI